MAIFGSIMPAPFDIPVIVTASPLIVRVFEVSLGTVSVVMIPRAACSHAAKEPSRLSTSIGRAACIFASGNCSPMTPVEYGSTWLASQLSCSLNVEQCFCATSIPGFPVPAFAFPELTNSARTAPLVCSAKCALATVTGAAQNVF